MDAATETAGTRPRQRRARFLCGSLAAFALAVTGCSAATTPAPTPPPTAQALPSLAAPIYSPPMITLHPETPIPTVAPPAPSLLPPTPPPAVRTPTRRPTARPTPTLIGSGYSDVVAALKAWIVGQGFRYSFDCATTWTDESDTFYCYSFWSHVSAGDVYTVAPRGAEPADYLLLKRVGGLWYVAAVATFHSGLPWH